MYTTKEAVKLLKRNDLGLVFHMLKNTNVRIFKTKNNDICVSELKVTGINLLKDYEKLYSKSIWITYSKR